MTSLTQQKADLREIIHKRVMESYEKEVAIDGARALIFGLLTRLTGRMTIRELQDWHFALYASELVEGE